MGAGLVGLAVERVVGVVRGGVGRWRLRGGFLGSLWA